MFVAPRDDSQFNGWKCSFCFYLLAQTSCVAKLEGHLNAQAQNRLEIVDGFITMLAGGSAGS